MPIRLAKIAKPGNKSAGKDMDQKEFTYVLRCRN